MGRIYADKTIGSTDPGDSVARASLNALSSDEEVLGISSFRPFTSLHPFRSQAMLNYVAFGLQGQVAC